MEQKFTYHFDVETGILYKTYYGAITIDDINSSWEYAIREGIIPPETCGFVLDYREAHFDIPLGRHHEIADFYKNHIDVFGGFKIAIITDNSKDIVIPVLVEMLDEGYVSRPFTTVEAAVEWIMIDAPNIKKKDNNELTKANDLIGESASE